MGIEFIRKVDKHEIPVCPIMGVNIAAVDMKWLLNYTKKISKLFQEIICA